METVAELNAINRPLKKDQIRQQHQNLESLNEDSEIENDEEVSQEEEDMPSPPKKARVYVEYEDPILKKLLNSSIFNYSPTGEKVSSY